MLIILADYSAANVIATFNLISLLTFILEDRDCFSLLSKNPWCEGRTINKDGSSTGKLQCETEQCSCFGFFFPSAEKASIWLCFSLFRLSIWEISLRKPEPIRKQRNVVKRLYNEFQFGIDPVQVDCSLFHRWRAGDSSSASSSSSLHGLQGSLRRLASIRR